MFAVTEIGGRKLDRGFQTIDPAPELDDDVILYALGCDFADLITGAEQGAERGGLRSRSVVLAVGRDPNDHRRGSGGGNQNEGEGCQQ
jgi:hypothetical protein